MSPHKVGIASSNFPRHLPGDIGGHDPKRLPPPAVGLRLRRDQRAVAEPRAMKSAGRLQPNFDHFREICKCEIFGPPLQLRADSQPAREGNIRIAIAERAIRSGLSSGWPSQDTGPRQSRQSLDGASDDHQLQLRGDSPEIVSVAGYHGLPGPLRTNDDVGIDDVGRPGSCQQ